MRFCTAVSLSFWAVFAIGLGPASAANIALWNFESSLESETGHPDLLELAVGGGFPEYFFDEVEIDGELAEVAYFTRGTYFWVNCMPEPNGGGEYTNQFTLIMDVMFPDRSPSGGWASLFQTNDTNTNDGDWFVNPDGGVGVAGNYGGTVPDGEWHRLALVVDLAAQTYTSYVDGVQAQQNTGGDYGVDGRFSLYTINHANPGLWIFADDNGDDAEGYVGSVQFRDVSMTAAEVEAMGGPSADGVPLPSDPRECGLRGFSVAYDAATSSVTGTWESIEGDEGFRVFEGARQIGGDLPADATSFVDDAPPPAGVVTYTLSPLIGGAVERECESAEIETFGCASDIVCCVDQGALSVELTWTGPVNVPNETYTIRRDDVTIGTAATGATSFADDPLPGPGIYTYELAVTAEGGAEPICTVACLAVVTGVDAPGEGDCGGVVNQYDFNGDLTSSTGGRDLEPLISAPLIDGVDLPGVEFLEVDIAGENAEVAQYTRGTIFRMFAGLPPNGGGQFTNQYSLLMDVMFPEGALDESGWAAFYNTNDNNANDGDWFLQAGDRGIGISANYGGQMNDDTWYRIALVVDLVAGTYTSYINGEPVMQNTGLALEGRFALYSLLDDPLGLDLFADDSAENAGGFVNSVQLRDSAMSASDVAAFGGPSAAGIPFFPPCPAGLSCLVDQDAKTATLTWANGVDTAGTGYTIRRSGSVVGTAALDETSFTDANVPVGVHTYELAIDGGDASCGDLGCRAFVVGPNFFFDDFDSYATDADLLAAGWETIDDNEPLEAATWTVETAKSNPPTFDGTASNGRFVISDSDAGGTDELQNPPGSGMAYNLLSPAFSTSGASVVWLHLDVVAQLNNNGEAVFEIDASTDDGASWTNVFQRVAPARSVDPFPEFDENADGYFGRLDVDLSAVAANQDSVRVRLRHLEPNWDWYIAADNFLVDDQSPGGSVELLAGEGFDEGIPKEWTVLSGPDSQELGTWNTEDLCQISLLATGGVFPDTLDGRALHHFDEEFALADPTCSFSQQDEMLITPPVNASAVSTVYLHVRSVIVSSTAATAQILLSLDGGETFLPSPVFSYNGGGLFDSEEDPFYGDYVFEVPEAGGESDVAFAFHYKTTGTPATWWALDDISITGSAGGGGDGEFRRGDPDNSGGGNITDAIAVLNHLFAGNAAPVCFEAADVNDDSAVNIADPVYHLNFLFGGGPPPALPGPDDCGPDPDPESSVGCDFYDKC